MIPLIWQVFNSFLLITSSSLKRWSNVASSILHSFITHFLLALTTIFLSKSLLIFVVSVLLGVLAIVIVFMPSILDQRKRFFPAIQAELCNPISLDLFAEFLLNRWANSLSLIYGPDYNEFLVDDLTLGAWNEYIHSEVKALKEAGQHKVYLRSQLEYIRKINFQGDTFHVVARFSEHRVLRKKDQGVYENNPETDISFDVYYRFILHEGKWKIDLACFEKAECLVD